jgi:hypothetical protein
MILLPTPILRLESLTSISILALPMETRRCALLEMLELLDVENAFWILSTISDALKTNELGLEPRFALVTSFPICLRRIPNFFPPFIEDLLLASRSFPRLAKLMLCMEDL